MVFIEELSAILANRCSIFLLLQTLPCDAIYVLANIIESVHDLNFRFNNSKVKAMHYNCHFKNASMYK